MRVILNVSIEFLITPVITLALFFQLLKLNRVVMLRYYRIVRVANFGHHFLDF